MKSVYDFEVGSELTKSTRRPARKSFKSRYFQALHWQFLIAFIIFLIIAERVLIKTFGIFSYPFVASPVIFLFLCYLAVPIFNILKAYHAPRTRKILSFLFTFLIVIGTTTTIPFDVTKIFSIPIFNVRKRYDQTQHKSYSSNDRISTSTRNYHSSKNDHISTSAMAPVYCSVEFQITPFASVHDITDENSPRFLFESHYKTIQLKRGRHILRFDYDGTSYTVELLIRSTSGHVFYFDIQTEKSYFSTKGG